MTIYLILSYTCGTVSLSLLTSFLVGRTVTAIRGISLTEILPYSLQGKLRFLQITNYVCYTNNELEHAIRVPQASRVALTFKCCVLLKKV